MSTEKRNPRSYGLDRMSAQEMVRLMNEEEMAVFRALNAAEGPIAIAAEHAAEAIRSGGRVLYLGAGTSGRIAAVDAAEMPPTFGIDPDRFVAIHAGGDAAMGQAVEDAEDDPTAPITLLNQLDADRNDVVIGLAASGRTPFVIGGIRHARAKGIWTCAIVNNKEAPLLKEADHAIILETGPEVLTGSTRLKAGTAQKLVLNRISTIAMVLNGKVIENLMVDVKAKNQKLKERCVRIVRELSNLTEVEAQDFLEANDWNVRAVLDAARARV